MKAIRELAAAVRGLTSAVRQHEQVVAGHRHELRELNKRLGRYEHRLPRDVGAAVAAAINSAVKPASRGSHH